MKQAARRAQQETTVADRRQRVAALLRAGWTQQEIAGHLGVSESTISRDVEALGGQWVRAAGQDWAEEGRSATAQLDVDEDRLRGALDQARGPREVALLMAE